MFDATKGQQAVTSQIETLSDEFAARFTEMGPREQLAFLQKANVLLDDPSQVSAFQAGTYAQNSAGQPAAALGAGTDAAQPTITPQQAVQAIMDNRSVDSGIKLAIRRLLTPSDPERIQVESNGTPTELVNIRRELATAQEALEQVRADLAQARTDLAAARNSAGGYDQALARPVLDEVDQAVEDLVGKMGGRVEGKSELKQKINALLRAVHLTRA